MSSLSQVHNVVGDVSFKSGGTLLYGSQGQVTGRISQDISTGHTTITGAGTSYTGIKTPAFNVRQEGTNYVIKDVQAKQDIAKIDVKTANIGNVRIGSMTNQANISGMKGSEAIYLIRQQQQPNLPNEPVNTYYNPYQTKSEALGMSKREVIVGGAKEYYKGGGLDVYGVAYIPSPVARPLQQQPTTKTSTGKGQSILSGLGSSLSRTPAGYVYGAYKSGTELVGRGDVYLYSKYTSRLPTAEKWSLMEGAWATQPIMIGSELFKGGYNEIRAKPLSTALNYAGSIAFFYGTGYMGLMGKPLITKGSSIVGWGLTGLYAGTTAWDIGTAPKGQRIERAGGHLFGEVLPMVAGAYTAKAMLGSWTVKGRTNRFIEQLHKEFETGKFDSLYGEEYNKLVKSEYGVESKIKFKENGKQEVLIGTETTKFYNTYLSERDQVFFKSYGGKNKIFSVIESDDTQYTTLMRNFKGRDYLIFSKTSPTGLTFSNIYENKKLAFKFNYQSWPEMKWTKVTNIIGQEKDFGQTTNFEGAIKTTFKSGKIEGISLLEHKNYLLEPEYLIESKNIKPTGATYPIREYIPKGFGIEYSQINTITQTIKPAITIGGEITTTPLTNDRLLGLNSHKQLVWSSPYIRTTGINILSTTYKYVDYPTPGKKILWSKLNSNIEYSSPAISLTTQTNPIAREFYINYIDRNVKISDFNNKYLANIFNFKENVMKETNLRGGEINHNNILIKENNPMNLITKHSSVTQNIQIPMTQSTFQPLTYYQTTYIPSQTLKTHSFYMPLLFPKLATNLKEETNTYSKSKPIYIMKQTPLSFTNLKIESSQIPFSETKLNQKNTIKNETVSTPITIPSQISKQQQKIEQIQIPITKQETKQKQRFQLIPVSSPIIPRWEIPTTRKTPLGFLNIKFKKTSFKRRVNGKGFSKKSKYTPSLEAQLFNIAGKKPSKQQIESGLIIRPLLKSSRRKRRK